MVVDTEKLFSVAGRIYVLLRRETNRMVDVEWIIANAAYATEVIRLAKATGQSELIELAERIEETHPLLPHPIKPKPLIPAEVVKEESKYVNTLR